ncbi:MAG TPA: AzlC family ABC transporter permease [Candidatus Thermoplasmatota archaeon]|nr:AzlC family ABC transporter permease [Candidatus Thermoplasmatota archaeon]
MSRHPVAEGALRALTLAPGIVPVGMLFGATAVAAGLSPLAAATMSGLVFAGSAQFASVGLLASGAAVASCIALVAIVNARYFLLSAATLDLGRRTGATWWERTLLALGVVDETYALQAAWVKTAMPSALGLFALSATFWLMWVAGTLAGALLGERLPDLAPLGLDYALPGIAVGLLGIFADTRERLLAGLAALAGAGALAWYGHGTWAILLIPPALALALGKWRPARAA